MITLIYRLITQIRSKQPITEVDKKKVVYNEKCDSEWQVSQLGGNAGYLIKCRKCGVILASHGTPKCLATK